MVPSSPPVLAILPDYPSLSEQVLYQINGLIVVFLALSAIWAVTELIGFFFKRSAANAKAVAAAAPAPSAAPAAPAPAPSAVSPEVYAAIAAAVHVTFGTRARIRGVAAAAEVPVDWAKEGRRQIFASHQVR